MLAISEVDEPCSSTAAAIASVAADTSPSNGRLAKPDQELFRGNINGRATLEVIDDFSSIPSAVSRLVEKTQNGTTDVLARRPFDGGVLLAAVLEELDATDSDLSDPVGADGKCLTRSRSIPERL